MTLIFDTSIFIDNLRAGRHRQNIDSVTGLIRMSSVVLAELWRGAATAAERNFLQQLGKNHPILTPSELNWLDSGQILGKMHIDHGFDAGRLRDLHFDVLIALTARAYGARLITSNRRDFELISHYRKIDLEVW